MLISDLDNRSYFENKKSRRILSNIERGGKDQHFLVLKTTPKTKRMTIIEYINPRMK
jgi:hypothetical protein